MNQRDLVASIVTLGIGLVGLWGMSRVPFGNLHQPAGAFFPVILSVLIILLSLGLLVSSARTKIKRGLPALGERWKDLMPAVAALIAYVILVKPLGYVVCTTLIILLFVRLEAGSWKAAVLLSFLCTLISYGVFKWYLMAPLPAGIIPF